MAYRQLKQISDQVYIMLNDATGIAFAEDRATGHRYGAHPCVKRSESGHSCQVLGDSGQQDRVLVSGIRTFHIDVLLYTHELNRLACMYCQCLACRVRDGRRDDVPQDEPCATGGPEREHAHPDLGVPGVISGKFSVRETATKSLLGARHDYI
jgi:hypothetical protein